MREHAFRDDVEPLHLNREHGSIGLILDIDLVLTAESDLLAVVQI